MNLAKGQVFDGEAGAPWALADYGEEDRPKLVRLLAAAELSVGAQVLEPGCGTGRLTAGLADAVGPPGRIVALALSRTWLALAPTVCQAMGQAT